MNTSTSPDATKPLKGRVALVTGATRGIGRAVAVAMAKAGAHVIATGRTAGALEEVDDEIRAAGGEATLLTLNMKHGQKIDALGPTIFNRWGRLDVLVANAGVLGTLSPLGHLSTESWAETIDINLNANWRLIRTLDPVLKLSDSGRAIFVTSGAASASLGENIRPRNCIDEHPREPDQSRPNPHRYARQGISGRRPNDFEDTRRYRATLRKPRFVVTPGQWPNPRLRNRRCPQLSYTG
jgi:NAD(P)-dependent dehydrogenase (short-subunit alcohol dehydrogenase family)